MRNLINSIKQCLNFKPLSLIWWFFLYLDNFEQFRALNSAQMRTKLVQIIIYPTKCYYILRISYILPQKKHGVWFLFTVSCTWIGKPGFKGRAAFFFTKSVRASSFLRGLYDSGKKRKKMLKWNLNSINYRKKRNKNE
jgi:hypothetical protein